MDRRGMWAILVVVAAAAIVFGFFRSEKKEPGKPESESAYVVPPLAADDSSGEPLTADTFRKIAKRLNPTVVNIYTTQTIVVSPFGDLFEDPFFRRFFGDVPNQEYKQNALGSGVVVDPKGEILTNNHVIAKADEIRVLFEDAPPGQKGYEAKVVGADPKTDLALIRVGPGRPVPAAPLGDSEALQVGDWVIAIGNPFNFGHTVTVGVVSAKGRALGGTYDDFIQTDASINPGNSGGPLLNLRGEVVGINAAIYSQTGQSAGIGFAIPVNLAKEIIGQLKETGHVTRGQLGVSLQSQWSDRLAKEFGVDHGAIVSDVAPGSPADKAGVERGDVIVEYNGQEIKSGSELPSLIAATRPGTKVQLRIVRDKKEMTVSAVVGGVEESGRSREGERSGRNMAVDLGLSVTDIDRRTARQLGLESTEGVIITRVRSDTAAENAGLRRGDVVLEIERRPVRSAEDFQRIISGTRSGQSLLLLIYRNGQTYFTTIDVP
jgi:serine protease Do